MKPLFDSVNRLEGALTFHRARHTVLAGNIANSDTPGYKPVDLERKPVDDITAASAPGATDFVEVFDDTGASVSADGNAVNLERELAKLDANRVRYTVSSELVSRRMALLRYAATDGNG